MNETSVLEQKVEMPPSEELQEEGGEKDPGKLLLLIKSRKFWAALVGLLIIIAQGIDADFPLETEATTQIVYMLVAYILGTAIEDGGYGTK
jgi:hypothetical protein